MTAMQLVEIDGETFEFPADATDVEIAQALGAMTAPAATKASAPAQPAAPPQPGVKMRPDGGVDTDSFLRAVSPGWTPAPESDMRAAIMRPSGPVTATGTATAALQGANDFMADLAGAPVDLVNNAPRLANFLPGVSGVGPFSDRPIGGSESIRSGARTIAAMFGTAPYEPQNAVERVAYRTGGEIGATALPVGGVMAAGARLGVQGARELARSENMIARIYGRAAEAAAVNPSGVAAREAMAATAAGTGAGIANELAGNPQRGDNFASDFGGSLAGVTALGIAAPVLGAVRGAVGTAMGNPKFADDVARREVADRISDNSAAARDQFDRTGTVDTAPIVAALRRPAPIEEAVRGYVADIGERTGDPGLQSFVRREGSARPGAEAGRRAANDRAVENRLAELEPQGSPGAFRAGLEAGRDARLADVDSQAAEAALAAERARDGIAPGMTAQARGQAVRTAADDALDRFIAETQAAQRTAARTADDAVARLAPQSDPAVRGNVIRSVLETGRDEARRRTAEAYRAAGLEGKAVDLVPLVERLDEAVGGMTAVERGLVPRDLIDRVRSVVSGDDPPLTGLAPDEQDIARAIYGRAAPTSAPARLKEASDLRAELARRERAASVDSLSEKGGRNAARVIEKLRGVVDTYIDEALSPAERDAFAAARGAKFDEAEAFTRAGDPVASVLARTEGGIPRVRDERVASTFVSPASDAALARLFAQADTPQVRNAIRDEILSNLGSPTQANAARLERFVEDFDIPLRQFPGLRDEILGASRARRAADAAGEAVEARRAEFADGSRALADTTARRGDGLPSVADEALPGRFVGAGGTRDLDALLSRADTPDVRQAIEDEILSRVSVGAATPEALRDRVGRFAGPLSRFPGLEARILGAADASAVERFGRDVAADTRRDLTTPGRSTVANYLKFDDSRTADAVRTVTNAAQPERAMRELLEAAGGSPEAVRNARSAFWRVLREDGKAAAREGGERWDGRALSTFLRDPKNDAVARVLYADRPDELDDMRQVFDALAGANAARRTVGSPRTEGLRPSGRGYDAALSASSIASRARSVSRGQLSPTIAVIDVVATFLRRRSAQMQAGAIERLQDEMIANPGLAARLLEDYNPADYAAKRRMITQRYGVRATQTLNLLDDMHEEERDPVRAAVMR